MSFPLVSIVCHKGEGRGSEAIVIRRTTEWASLGGLPNQPVFKDRDERALVCRVRSRGREMTVGCLYPPSVNKERSVWLPQCWEEVQSLPYTLDCDIVAGDWNEILAREDRAIRRPLHRARNEATRRLIEALGGTNSDLIDGWRESFPKLRAYSFIRDNKGVSRLDRIYLRSDWYHYSKGWDLKPTSLDTDHLAAVMCLTDKPEVQRGPGRWRLNPELLRSKMVIESCVNAFKVSLVNGRTWLHIKQEIGKWLQEYSQRH